MLLWGYKDNLGKRLNELGLVDGDHLYLLKEDNFFEITFSGRNISNVLFVGGECFEDYCDYESLVQ